MKQKTKKNQNINIVIENNIFSKNKESKKKDYPEPPPDNNAGGGASLEYSAPFQPEPSFIADIRQAFSDKNMYALRHNTEPPEPMYNTQGHPVYNHYYNTPPHQATQEEDDTEELPQLEQQEEDTTLTQAPTPTPQIIYDVDGVYKGPNDPATREKFRIAYRKALRWINTREGTKPQRRTIEKFSLQRYFPDLYPDYNPP